MRILLVRVYYILFSHNHSFAQSVSSFGFSRTYPHPKVFNFSTIDILDPMILCRGQGEGWPVLQTLFSSISDFYPIDASWTSPAVTPKIFLYIAKCPLDIKPGDEMTLGSESLPVRFHSQEPFREKKLFYRLSFCHCHHILLYIPIRAAHIIEHLPYARHGAGAGTEQFMCKYMCSQI